MHSSVRSHDEDRAGPRSGMGGEHSIPTGATPSLRARFFGELHPSRVLLLLPLLLILATSSTVRAADDEEIPDEPAKARLVADVTAIRPGTTFHLGVHFTMVEHWHIYWHSAREGGLGTQVIWTLPEGWSAGPVRWPTPRRYDLEGDTAVAFGYDDAVLLASEITVPENATIPEGGKITLGATLSWLVCKELCVIGDGTPSLTLPILPAGSDEPAAIDAKTRALFETARARLPKTVDQVAARSSERLERPSADASPTEWTIGIEWPEGRRIVPFADPSVHPRGTAHPEKTRFLLYPFDVPGATLGLGTIEDEGSATTFRFTLDVWDTGEFDPARVGAVIEWEESTGEGDGAKRVRNSVRITAAGEKASARP